MNDCASYCKKAVFTRATPQIRTKSPKSPNGPIFSALFPDEARLKEIGPPKKVSYNETHFLGFMTAPIRILNAKPFG